MNTRSEQSKSFGVHSLVCFHVHYTYYENASSLNLCIVFFYVRFYSSSTMCDAAIAVNIDKDMRDVRFMALSM